MGGLLGKLICLVSLYGIGDWERSLKVFLPWFLGSSFIERDVSKEKERYMFIREHWFFQSGKKKDNFKGFEVLT